MIDIPDTWTKDTNFQKAAERYHAVYDKLTPEKAHVMDQICGAFSEAYCSYMALNAKSKDSTDRIYEAGLYADRFLIKFKYVMELLGLDEAGTETKLDATSAWLESRQWISLPKYYDIEGNFHQPTAHGVHFDMKANSAAMHRLRSVAASEDDGKRKERKSC